MLIDTLPDKIYLNNYNGNFERFLEACYEIFRYDFVVSKPTFIGKRLGLKRYPLQMGKEYTFYHFTHSGTDEQNRQPDLRRMEMIGFPRPLIDICPHDKIKIWRNKRGNSERILIYYEYENYLVILDDRGDYILPWTAYIVDYPSRRRKLIKEYETYLKAKTA